MINLIKFYIILRILIIILYKLSMIFEMIFHNLLLFFHNYIINILPTKTILNIIFLKIICTNNIFSE